MSTSAWGAVAFSHWGTTFWSIAVGHGPGTLGRYHDPGGGTNPVKLTFGVDARWDETTGVIKAVSIEERPPIIRLSMEGRIRADGCGGDIKIHETDRSSDSDRTTEVVLNAVVLMGRREEVFSRLGAMYDCALVTLMDAGADASDKSLGTTVDRPVPVDAGTLVGEWTGLALSGEILLTLRARRGGKSLLAITQINGTKMTTDVLQGTVEIVGKSFRFGHLLHGELTRMWGAGFGHGWLHLPEVRKDGIVEVYFFMQKDSAWLANVLQLNRSR